MCIDCLNLLNKISEFYNLCQNSQDLLKKYFESQTNATKTNLELLQIEQIKCAEDKGENIEDIVEDDVINEYDESECNEENLENQSCNEDLESENQVKSKNIIRLECRICEKIYKRQVIINTFIIVIYNLNIESN